MNTGHYKERMPTEDEVQDFLANAEDVNKKVRDIIEGKIDFEEYDAAELRKEKLDKAKAEIKEREARAHVLKGRPGKGHQGGYKLICTRCFTEYWIDDIDTCTHCGKELITQEERMADLREKLEEYKQKKAKKMTRRAKWENWQKTQAMFYCKTSTNYNKWDMFESEESEEEKDPIVPKNDPQFKAMEQDFADRAVRRARDRKAAEALKVKGNDAVNRGLYKSARHHYSEALELKKDYLALYTNRALACLKLEDMQQAIDDCSRVLEYCEVFDDGYEKQRDLCYKALMRRGQALKHQRDFQLAMNDFEEAGTLIPGETDPAKWQALTAKDKEHAEKLKTIMENADSLAGKEYIDYLLLFLKGKKDVDPLKKDAKNKKRQQICFHEITQEQKDKLAKILEDSDMVYYFNVQEGCAMLVDSLYESTIALGLIQSVLEKNGKLQDDFQRQHLYEALIDFLQVQNQNAEGKTLAHDDMVTLLQILENGSMNEAVRSNLSEKKKIKDLFLVVIRSIDIKKNKVVVSSLIQFISNLCYGTGRLRTMLAKEDTGEFMATLKQILVQVKEKDEPAEDEDKDEFEKKEVAHKSLAKSAVYCLCGNLCIEKKLRVSMAADEAGVLSQVLADFRVDQAAKKFDWLEMMSKQLAVFVNVSIEKSAQTLFANAGLMADLEAPIMFCQTTDESQKELLVRLFNLLSKCLRHPGAAAQVAKMKKIVFKAILFMHSQYEGELQMNALRTLHPLCRVEGFRAICLDEHKLTAATFNTYVKEIQLLFKGALKAENWETFVNACGSMTAFYDCFPERAEEFQGVILDLIHIVKEKTEVLRKNAAILLAKLAQNEENNKFIRANHGFDVLMSLKSVFL